MRLRRVGDWMRACAIGVALGGAYAASPVAVWFVVLLAGVFVWAGRGLGERERRYVWTVLAAAVAIRVIAIAVLFATSGNGQLISFPWDGDGVYIKYRAMVISDVWTGVPVGAIDAFNAFMPYYGWSAFIYVLAYINFLTGPAPYAIHLLNVLLFVSASTILFRMTRTAFGRVPALLGWVLVLFMPTLVAWSVTALKESMCVFLFAVALRALIGVARGLTVTRRMIGAIVLLGALAAVNQVRVGAMAILMAGLAAGVVAAVMARRPLLAAGVIACLPVVGIMVWERPAVKGAVMAQLNAAAVYHRAAFWTDGDSYDLLDDRFYRGLLLRKDSIELSPDQARQFVVKAITSFVALPLPWRTTSKWGAIMMPQQLLWYALLPLACIGCVIGLRRDVLMTSVLVGIVASGAAAFAINNGNVGTMVRFRDWIVPFVVWLSALGGSWALVRLMPTSALWAAPGAPATSGERAAFAGGNQIVSH